MEGVRVWGFGVSFVRERSIRCPFGFQMDATRYQAFADVMAGFKIALEPIKSSDMLRIAQVCCFVPRELFSVTVDFIRNTETHADAHKCCVRRRVVTVAVWCSHPH